MSSRVRAYGVVIVTLAALTLPLAVASAGSAIRDDGGFVGLGLELDSNLSGEGYMRVVRVLEQAGDDVKAAFREGDLISHVEGKSVQGLSAAEIVALIRGPEGTEAGTTVRLTLQRAGEAKEVSVKRKLFKPGE